MPVVSDNADLEILACDESAARLIREQVGLKVLRHTNVAKSERLRNVFVLCSVVDLPAVSSLVSHLNRLHRLRVLFLREQQAEDATWLPQMLERANIRALRNMLVHAEDALPARVLNAWKRGDQNELIAKATVADETLFVVSCAMEAMEVPFEAVPALRMIPLEERKLLEVATDGSYLHWPDADVHLDLDAIRAAIDPDYRNRIAASRLASTTRYGKVIATLRKEANLRQADVTGLSQRQLRRIEAGGQVTVASLEALAAAHGLSPEEYTAKVANRARSPGESTEG